MWQQYLLYASAMLFFGFVILGGIKYGLLDCYSAYAAKWQEFYPKLNIWSVVTFISAFLMMPVILEQSKDNPWQFLGFLAPVSLFFVAGSPRYASETFQWLTSSDQLDAGYAYVAPTGSDVTRFGKAVRRKTLGMINERLVLQDTNNSSDDFEMGVPANPFYFK